MHERNIFFGIWIYLNTDKVQLDIWYKSLANSQGNMKWATHCSNKVECTLVNEKDVLDFERDFKIDAAYSLQAASLTDL